ncbi:MAG: DNA polymerase IV [Deltaproteobacteria bacterium]|nr:DNA polymerase IV [Deltaproteobacteria bacterium]
MIFHIDMDAFYASVEQRDNPELRGRCVVVGGSSNRGVVSAASYEARKFGVHSAMPIFQVKKCCPDAVFVRPRMRQYQRVSKQIMAILSEFSPLVEPVSIDEAYMDVSGFDRLYDSPAEMGKIVKDKIRKTVGLTCSIGIAPLRFLAKIASDLDKPDGLYVIEPLDMPAFITELPIRKVPGVGAQTQKQLKALSIETLGDVNKFPPETIIKRLGKFGHRLLALASGMDSTEVTPHSPVKSISSEHTLSADTSDRDLMRRYLQSQSEEVGQQLRRKRFRARTVTLKLKDSDFKQVSRSSTLPAPTQSAETIYRAALRLFDAYDIRKKIRLVGVGASNLVTGSTPVQMDLFNGPDQRDRTWEKVDKALDSINQKFGKASIRKASLAESESSRSSQKDKTRDQSPE